MRERPSRAGESAAAFPRANSGYAAAFRISHVGLLCAAACSAPAPAQEISGRFVTLHVHAEGLPCAGVTRTLDEFVVRAFAALEAPVPAGFMADVYFAPFEEFEELSPCLDLASAGCVVLEDPTVAWAQSFDAIPHELAHVVHNEVMGTSAPALREGLAELLGDRVHEVPAAPTLSVAEIAMASADDVQYAEAARLVSFLIDHYGMSRFKDLFQRSTHDHVPEEAWEQALGTGLADLDASYLVSPPACMLSLGACEVGAPSIKVPGSLEVGLSCSDPASWGFEFSRGSTTETGAPHAADVSQPFFIDIEQTGLLEIDGDIAIELNPCAPCEGPSLGLARPLEVPYQLELAVGRGRYEARAVASSGAPSQPRRVDLKLLPIRER